MKIGIISDSHDHFENIKKAVQLFRDAKVSYVVHLGDFVNPGSIKLFHGIKLKAVFGNNDGDKFRLMNSFSEIGGEINGDFYEFEEDGLKFACCHGTDFQIKEALIKCGIYDVVMYGHTHKCENRKTGNTLALNPGTAHGFRKDATIMLFDTKTGEAEIINL
ncbi:MAG: metallophosphoesterase [Nitrospiraceae bacterium]|nr:MAG: metallophosphoesterase [Nitrospiraceae bacterium]